jgi:hypothetical protein
MALLRPRRHHLLVVASSSKVPRLDQRSLFHLMLLRALVQSNTQVLAPVGVLPQQLSRLIPRYVINIATF